MNKQTLVDLEDRWPRTTHFLIRFFSQFVVFVCCRQPHRKPLGLFLSQKDFVYRFRFSFWLFIQRFKIKTANDINFRPFSSLDCITSANDDEKYEVKNIIRIIIDALSLKKSIHEIHKINALDLMHLLQSLTPDMPNKECRLCAHINNALKQNPLANNHFNDIPLEQSIESPNVTTTPTNHSDNYNTDDLDTALLSITEFLRAKKVDYFLMSGTLLGLIRNKRPLKKDDIDIGIYANKTDFDQMIQWLNSKRIVVDDIQAPYLIKCTIAKVSIDLFFHFEEGDDIWHGSIYHRWYNRKFSHGFIDYKNNRYCIPEQYEHYLEENYGDWRTPVTKFSIYLDCPNYRPQYNYDALVFIYKNLLACELKNDPRSATIHYKQCKEIVSHLC